MSLRQQERENSGYEIRTLLPMEINTMDDRKILRIELTFSSLTVTEQWLGEDILLTVAGGEKPHIGTAVLALPRPSLSGDGSRSATSSVLNVTGHKDEEICRFLAERAAAKYGVRTAAVGGFHVDGIRPEEIRELKEALAKIEL